MIVTDLNILCVFQEKLLLCIFLGINQEERITCADKMPQVTKYIIDYKMYFSL